jgi:hypothetical protein
LISLRAGLLISLRAGLLISLRAGLGPSGCSRLKLLLQGIRSTPGDAFRVTVTGGTVTAATLVYGLAQDRAIFATAAQAALVGQAVASPLHSLGRARYAGGQRDQ